MSSLLRVRQALFRERMISMDAKTAARDSAECYEDLSVRIVEPGDRSPELKRQLVGIWERSVRETHLFLTDAAIAGIREYVPQAIEGVEHLLIAETAERCPVAFMGIDGDRLEMLFLAPEERGKGLGARLLHKGIMDCGVSEVTVNEQNPQAVGFYQHMGFEVYKRTETDEQGGPYPLLYMRLNG